MSLDHIDEQYDKLLAQYCPEGGDGIVRFVVNSDKKLVECDNLLLAMYKKFHHLTLSVRPGVDRSVLQNNLWAGMYKRIGQVLHWGFPHARAHCKLYLGIPILKRDSEGFSESFDRIFGNLTEEAALKLMNPNKLFPRDGFPVTRNFGTKQGCEYTDMIVEAFMGQVSFVDMLKDG